MSVEKRPWWKRTWVWVAIGAAVVIGAVGNLLGGGREDDPRATTLPPAASSAPTPTESVSEPAPEPTEALPSDDERTATFEQALRDAFGDQDYADVFASDPSLWYGWISGVRVDGANAYVTLQVGSEEDEREDLGERAAAALPSLIPAEATDGISWIIVEDAGGVVIDQSSVG